MVGVGGGSKSAVVVESLLQAVSDSTGVVLPLRSGGVMLEGLDEHADDEEEGGQEGEGAGQILLCEVLGAD